MGIGGRRGGGKWGDSIMTSLVQDMGCATKNVPGRKGLSLRPLSHQPILPTGDKNKLYCTHG